jgi:hypothetical protein
MAVLPTHTPIPISTPAQSSEYVSEITDCRAVSRRTRTVAEPLVGLSGMEGRAARSIAVYLRVIGAVALTTLAFAAAAAMIL